MFAKVSNRFLDMIEVPVDGTRPHRNTPGVGFVLGASNVMGSYSQFLDGATAWPANCSDGYGIYLEFNVVSVASQIHNALATIGIDLAGGSSYTDWISNILITDAPTTSVGTVRYFFPIRVPKGASLAVKGQDSNAVPLASSYIRCQIQINPTRPELVRYGTFVQTFGVDTANSAGTAIVTGAASEGAYTEIGTLDKPLKYLEWGKGNASNALAGGMFLVDMAIGDATNKRRTIANAMGFTGASESIEKTFSGAFTNPKDGDKIYARQQTGASSDGSPSIAAYGVGGGPLQLVNEFLLTIETPVDGTRPQNTTGAAFTLGASDTMGSYAQLLDGSTAWPTNCSDGYVLELFIFNTAVASSNKNQLITIGIDPAGGTSYTDWITNLLVAGAPTQSAGAFRFRFPIRVPKGASLAIKGQDATAAPIATSYAFVKIACNPTRPELVRCGTYVQTFGANAGTTDGVAFTIGSVSEGAYVEIGTLDKPIWYWEYGIASDATSWTATEYYIDLAVGDATNKSRVVFNARGVSGTGETYEKGPVHGQCDDIPSGVKIYGRGQAGDNLGFTSASIAAYGVGG